MHLFNTKFIKTPAGVTELSGSVTTPAGFRASGIAAGLKKSGKSDLGILMSDTACSSAAVFTANAAAAAPILVCREELKSGSIQAVVVNSGSANACTGEQGMADARAMAGLTASKLGIDKELTAVASTGVIGVVLPMETVGAGIAIAADSLSSTGGGDFAEAIRTTDKIDKDGAVEVELSGGKVILGVCAKGAGMIAPNMATLLSFITTDASVPADLLQELLASAASSSYNAVTVDGDMSTNDFLLIMANGQSGVDVQPGSPDAALFGEALTAVCKGLAIKMVADGEGATKVVELNILGAASVSEAQKVAQAIANSSLVKTAFYGRDANWGRLMAAAGAALAGESQLLADIYYEDICVATGGAAVAEAPDAQGLKDIMLKQEISVSVDLHRGPARHKMYFSDLTHDYVTLNAEYTT